MAKICEDFTYNHKKMSDFGLMAVDFEDNGSIPLALGRDIIKGETNNYRSIANHFGTKQNDVLTFEIHLVKTNCEYGGGPDEMEIHPDELRQITRWLTSPKYPLWLNFEYQEERTEQIAYCGLFHDIEPFTVGGRIVGLKLMFTNNSSYGYVTDIKDSIVTTRASVYTVNNDSDLLTDYNYPVITITPEKTGQVYLCNLSDCELLDEGRITPGQTNLDSMIKLNQKISAYAVSKGYTVDYEKDHLGNSVTIGNNTAVQIRFSDSGGNVRKCIAFYQEGSGNYKIVRGGFLFFNVRQSLPLTIDCRLLSFYDSIGRMVLMKDIGVSDVDYIYWPRLKSGENTLLFYGQDCTFEITRTEERKAGAA